MIRIWRGGDGEMNTRGGTLPFMEMAPAPARRSSNAREQSGTLKWGNKNARHLVGTALTPSPVSRSVCLPTNGGVFLPLFFWRFIPAAFFVLTAHCSPAPRRLPPSRVNVARLEMQALTPAQRPPQRVSKQFHLPPPRGVKRLTCVHTYIRTFM